MSTKTNFFKGLTIAFLAVGTIACSDDDDNSGGTTVEAPVTYEFTRNDESSVSYSGQTTRIAMAEELASALKDASKTQPELQGMFDHGEGNTDFEDVDLNASSKNLRKKVAASIDFYSDNSTDALAIKADFDSWIANQVSDVYPNWDADATAGVAGGIQEAGGGSTRYVNEKGLEYNQAFAKGLIGALMVDQIVNNYLSTDKLDEGTNVEDNDADVVAGEGKTYTSMEHFWDEAFGYLYGAEENVANPTYSADSFLNKYVGRVEGDEDFAGIAQTIYDAFKLGRAAIVAKNYEVRDEQAEILRENISKVIGVRAVYYLQSGKNALAAGDNAAAFHDLSEGYGFIYGLQFTRLSNSNDPYVLKSEVDVYLQTLMSGDGFWDVTAEELDVISAEIASNFDFTVAEASN